MDAIPKETQLVHKSIKLAIFFVAILFFTAPSMAFGQDAATNRALINVSGAIGAGLVCIGSAFGIARLGASAVESMARQPEVKQNIFLTTLIVAALIEGFTFFAIYVCMQENPFFRG